MSQLDPGYYQAVIDDHGVGRWEKSGAIYLEISFTIMDGADQPQITQRFTRSDKQTEGGKKNRAIFLRLLESCENPNGSNGLDNGSMTGTEVNVKIVHEADDNGKVWDRISFVNPKGYNAPDGECRAVTKDESAAQALAQELGVSYENPKTSDEDVPF
ncbi:MAG: DUF669 domain-containing protein [Proteobacteria bacterium]|nr:DUF669 domain-containing protein [Pseudomonadota bacterium]